MPDKSSSTILMVLGLFLSMTASAQAYQTKEIHTKTAENAVDIIYPQGFGGVIDTKIKTTIDEETKSFINDLPLEDYPKSKWFGEPNRSYIQIKSTIKSNSPKVISILFHILTFGLGAAHPNGTLKTINFINGQKMELSDLFKPNSNYLSTIASYCYHDLVKQDMASKDVLKEGTRPIKENYEKWFLNKKGLVIAFVNDQISDSAMSLEAYVTIPYDTILSWPCTKK